MAQPSKKAAELGSLHVGGGVRSVTALEDVGVSGISRDYQLSRPHLLARRAAVMLELKDAPQPWALELSSDAVRRWERFAAGRTLVFRHQTLMVDWALFAQAPGLVTVVPKMPPKPAREPSRWPTKSWTELDRERELFAKPATLFDPARARVRAGRKDEHDRLPEIEVSYPYRVESAQLDTKVRLNLARLQGVQDTEALRYDTEFEISRKFEHQGWYTHPSLTMNYTQYNFANPDVNDLERSLPVWEVDNGWVFEQPIAGGGDALVQTVEPRIYYLYVPHVDQSRLPRRDVAQRPFGLGGLFSQYRLRGRDRIGDTNQASFGVTTRLLSDTDGVEYLRADLAQTLYFSEQQVEASALGLGGERQFSDIASSVAANVGGLELSSTVRWDTFNHEISTARTRVSHAINSRTAVSVSQLKYDETREAELRVQWLFNPAWGLESAVRHVLGDEQIDVVVAGFQYRGCGYSVVLDSQRRWNPTMAEHHYTVDLVLAVDARASSNGLRCR